MKEKEEIIKLSNDAVNIGNANSKPCLNNSLVGKFSLYLETAIRVEAK